MRIIAFVLIFIFGFGVLVCAKSIKVGKSEYDKGVFMKRAVKTDKLFVLPNIYDYEKLSINDRGGRYGDLVCTMETVAGLAALAVSEGKFDSLVFMTVFNDTDTRNNSKDYYEEILEITKMKPEKISNYDLIKHLQSKGIIKGYILYKRDDMERDFTHAYGKEYGKHSSINVATSLSPILGGIIVEKEAEPIFKALGLECLTDVSDKNEKWFFDNYKDKINKDIVFAIDPKTPDNRDYAVFLKAMVIYESTDFEDSVYKFLNPNAPVMGWNGGDEYETMSLQSKNGTYSTVSNWYFNMPIHTLIRPGTDIPWKNLQLNDTINPLDLKWENNAHYTSFILSDGDNVQWTVNDFIYNPGFWGDENRGAIPFGWGLPVVNEADINLLTLYTIAREKTENDYIMAGGINGPIYIDEYAVNRPDRLKVLAESMAKSDKVLAKFNVTTCYIVSAKDWKSKEALEAMQVIVDSMPHMDGFFIIEYTPYNARLGEVMWFKNKEGKPVPVISARYSIWKDATRFPLNGPPALVAEHINETSDGEEGVFIDWTVVHCWSYFTKSDTSKDIMAEEKEETNGEIVTRGFTPALWSAEKLNDNVKVVKPDELVWRAKLHMQTKDTLIYLANNIKKSKISKTKEREIDTYISWLKNSSLNTDAEKKAGFERLVMLSK